MGRIGLQFFAPQISFFSIILRLVPVDRKIISGLDGLEKGGKCPKMDTWNQWLKYCILRKNHGTSPIPFPKF